MWLTSWGISRRWRSGQPSQLWSPWFHQSVSWSILTCPTAASTASFSPTISIFNAWALSKAVAPGVYTDASGWATGMQMQKCPNVLIGVLREPNVMMYCGGYRCWCSLLSLKSTWFSAFGKSCCDSAEVHFVMCNLSELPDKVFLIGMLISGLEVSMFQIALTARY